MPIARVSGQGGRVTATAVSSISRAYPSNVSTDSLVVVGVSHYNSAASALAAGPYKSAGTATLGAWQRHADLLVTLNGNAIGVAIYSAPVTAGGSLSLAYDHGVGDSYFVVATDELTGADLSSSRALTGVSASSMGGSTAVDSGNLVPATGGAFLGMMAYHGSAGDTTITEDAAFDLIGEDENWAVDMSGSFIVRIITSALTDSASWTLGASRPWAACAAFVKEAVSGAPTLSLPGVQDITSTSARPKVTLTY